MSNFRKSLAIGTAASLAIAGLLGAPANAAVTKITLKPAAGSSQKAILGSNFIFRAAVVGATTGDNLKYLVEGIDAAADLYTAAESGVISLDSLSGYDLVEQTNGDATDDFAAADAITLNDDDIVVIDADSVTAGEYQFVSFGIDDANITDTTTVTLTPFIDTNDNGELDVDLEEFKGTSFAVTFVAPDEVTATVTASVNIGDATDLDATVELVGLNMGSMYVGAGSTLDQIATWSAKLNGVADGDAGDIDEADYSSTKGLYDFDIDLGAADGDIVLVQGFAGEETTGGNKVRIKVGSATIASFDDGANDNVEVADTQSYVIDDGAGDGDLRAGDGSFVAFVDALDSDGLAVGAGNSVTFTIAETGADTLDPDAAVKAGGKTLANDDAADTEEIEVIVQTDADGRASLSVSYTDVANADEFIISASVPNSAASSSLTLTGDTPDDLTLVLNNVDVNGSVVLEREKSLSLSLSLRDEYGLAPDSLHRAPYTISGAEMASDITGTATFNSAGNATVSFTDISDDEGTIQLAIENSEFEYKNAAGAWVDAAVEPADVARDIAVVDAKAKVVTVEIDTANSADDTTALAIFGYSYLDLDLQNVNSNFDTTWTTVFGAAGVVEVDVLDEDGVGVEGAAVTFSAPNGYWSDEGEDFFRKGSITVYSDANGNAIAYFESNIAGDVEITVTSGSGSDTLDLNVDNSTSEADVASWVITPTSTYVAPQSTLLFTAQAVDEFGNYVNASTHEVSLEYDGPGIVIPNDLTTVTATNAKGVVSMSVFLGANDKGNYEVTVTHEGADENIDATDDNVVGTYAFTIGTAPVVLTGKVNVGSFNGKLVVYAQGLAGAKISWKVGGKWGTANAVGNTLNRFDRVTPKKGVTVNVDIYVNGVKTLTKSVVTR